jgi:acetoacetyl-CoA synthetase
LSKGKKILWSPSDKYIEQTNMISFIKFVNKKYNLQIDSYYQLYDWSIERLANFWASMWEFAGIIASREYDQIYDSMTNFFDINWFPGARLNFAENLLKHRDDQIAYIFRGEAEKATKITYSDLYNQVGRLATTLRKIGVVPGDCVASYIPNLIETGVAMLAATSIGATWASCGAELGSAAVLDRLGQIRPKILFTSDGYFYKGKKFSILKNVEQVVKGIPSLEQTIVIPYIEEKAGINRIDNSIHYSEFLSTKKKPKIEFQQLPFNHPGYIMFSSGTTGKPKCMVQRTGGVLITQLRDLLLHNDLKRTDRITYITSPSWMMWHWLTSSLAVGTTIVLYDGNPLYPDWGTMWKLIQDERITIFGCSASYIHYLNGIGAQPKKDYDLSSLREISQTASSISIEGMNWLYRDVKDDFHFNSITEGSDLNAIFAGGCPILPLFAEVPIQCRALGMKVEAYDEQGNPVRDQQAELVVESPFPSAPLYFWDDPNNERYQKAYFDFYKPQGKLVWRHGDYVVIDSDTGGLTVFGRSDAVLKPSGVRIGTSEIYNIVESLPEVADCLAIGQSWMEDQRIILFVMIAPGSELTNELKNKIKINLRKKASPRHVPAIIIETPDIPYTFSMKKVEIAVTNILHGKPVTNREALSNPESLNFFEKIKQDLNTKT